MIKKGVRFLAIEKEGRYRFYPSRFLGYADNSMDAHDNNEWKDGRVTTPEIDKILGHKSVPNIELEREYRSYCEFLGFTLSDKGAFGKERKYWKL